MFMFSSRTSSSSMAMSTLLAGTSKSNRNNGNLSSLRSASLLSAAAAVAISSLVAYNIRWKYFIPTLLGKRHPRTLPTITVEGATQEEQKQQKSITVVLLHGMWQNATYFQELQDFLSEEGYKSCAIDLLPGERLLPGGTGHELVNDLEVTLKDMEGPYILLGHSKGGMLIQRSLQQSEAIMRQTVGVVLLGSYPLGLLSPIIFLQQMRMIFQDVFGVLSMSLLGKVRNQKYAKALFLLPSADETSDEMSNHLEKIIKAPADGVLFFPYKILSSSSLNIPALLMGASHDILCPPSVLKDAFDQRFARATHVTIPHQAHSFRDNGWEMSMLEPLIDWLNVQESSYQKTSNLEWTNLLVQTSSLRQNDGKR